MSPERKPQGVGYLVAVAAVAVATVVFLPFRSLLQPPIFMLLYVPVIIGVARFYGVRVSATAAVLAFLVLDLIFVPPYYRLTVASLPEWVALVVFLIVALVSGSQTAVLRGREQAALRRQSELEALNRLSFRVATEKSAESTAEFIVGQTVSVLGARRAAIYRAQPTTEALAILAFAGRPEPGPDEPAFAEWVAGSNKAIGVDRPRGGAAEEVPASVPPDGALPGRTAAGIYLPLQTAERVEGVLVAQPPIEGSAFTAEDSRLLLAMANLGAAHFERQRLEREAARAEALSEADRLKSTLVSSVSHELKTPLAAATARVTGLVDEGVSAGAQRMHDELVAVADDLRRLNSSIGDLLDLSRLESDAWRPQIEEHELSDVLGTVLSRLPADARARVRFELPEDLPTAHVDFAQMVRAFLNLVENALDYSPPGSPVMVGARASHGELIAWVQDEGPGVSASERANVFEKFYRGSAAAAAPAGTGLGLTITREIVRSNGARIWVEDAEPHGARFLIALPLTGPARKAEADGDA